MWMEAIITKEDFITVLDQLLPLKIHLDEDDSTDRWLHLEKPTALELVPDKGVRAACPAEIMWSISVVNVPIKLHTLQVLLEPEVTEKHRGEILEFKITLEEADIEGLPKLVDHTVMKAVNAALAKKELAWDFTKTLTNTVKMPKILEPIDSLSIRPQWSKRRVDDKAMVLAMSFELKFNRGD